MVHSDIKKIFFATVCLLQFGLLNANAQERENYSRVGLTIQGGYTMPGNAVYSSNLNAQTVASYNYGAGLKFAILPFWSVETVYRYNTIKGSESTEFETIMQSASLKNILNFNRLYQHSSISRILNVYALAGAGYDFYEYTSGNDQYQGKEPSFMGGLGLELSIGRAFDIFSQYELKFSSNGIENVNNGSRFIQIGMASAGVRINFGRDDARPLKHKTRFGGFYEPGNADFDMAEEPQTPLDEDIYEVESGEENQQTEETTENEQIEALTSRLAEVQENQAQIDEITNRLNHLQEKIDSLENKTDDLSAKTEQAPTAVTDSPRRNLSRGYYVQVFTGREYENAERVKNRFQALMAGELDDPDAKIFVNQRGPYHEVLIGHFSRLSDTSKILEIALGEFSDSFIFRN